MHFFFVCPQQITQHLPFGTFVASSDQVLAKAQKSIDERTNERMLLLLLSHPAPTNTCDYFFASFGIFNISAARVPAIHHSVCMDAVGKSLLFSFVCQLFFYFVFVLLRLRSKLFTFIFHVASSMSLVFG